MAGVEKFMEVLIIGGKEIGKGKFIKILANEAHKASARDNTLITMHIRSNDGNEDRDLTKEDCQNVNVILFCYSVADHRSIQALEHIYLKQVKQHLPRVPIILVALQIDKRPINYKGDDYLLDKDGENLKQNIKAHEFLPCSEKNPQTITRIFNSCIDVYSKAYLEEFRKNLKKRNSFVDLLGKAMQKKS